MALLRTLIAPVRRVLRFPLFQLAVVVLIILFLQAAPDGSIGGVVFDGLDQLVGATVGLFGSLFEVKSFTRSWLTSAFMIAYVYLAGLLVIYLLRQLFRIALDRAARGNRWLRNSLARERGIAAYRAWEPLENIRPSSVPQSEWEETYAWPANNKPPYPPLATRVLRGVFGYVLFAVIIGALLQWFTPFPVFSWIGRATRLLFG
jgi:small-conductance mechanosensitive channel